MTAKNARTSLAILMTINMMMVFIGGCWVSLPSKNTVFTFTMLWWGGLDSFVKLSTTSIYWKDLKCVVVVVVRRPSSVVRRPSSVVRRPSSSSSVPIEFPCMLISVCMCSLYYQYFLMITTYVWYQFFVMIITYIMNRPKNFEYDIGTLKWYLRTIHTE